MRIYDEREKLMMQKRAFTLAEVLITLTIIGVVAALTIPQVMSYTYEKEAVSNVDVKKLHY